jgi:MATE family multidrug resistance protein
MLAGQKGIAWLLVPASVLDTFIPAWVVAALIQPVNALSFATDGIHWGTGDFRFIRNAMVAASTTAIAALICITYLQPAAMLNWVWGITGLWTTVRAGFGLYRIWPGSPSAPLGRSSPL